MKEDQDDLKKDQKVLLEKFQMVLDQGVLQLQISTLILENAPDLPQLVLLASDLGFWRIKDEDLNKLLNVTAYNNAIDEYNDKLKSLIEEREK